HDASLALAGGLLRDGWEADQVAAIVEGVCAAAGDEEMPDRVRSVLDTARRLDSGNPQTTGWPALAGYLGQHGPVLVATVRRWLGVEPALVGGRGTRTAAVPLSSLGVPGAPPRRHVPLPPWRPFPTAALPEPWRALVRQGAAALGCDESYLALPALAVIAGAIGNTRRIGLRRDWSEPAVVWSGIIGESGTLKSPALSLVTEP